MTCRWCAEDAYDLLLCFGFTVDQAHALVHTRDTVFLVPVGGAS